MKKKYDIAFISCFLLMLTVSFGQEIISYNSFQDPACSGFNTIDPNVTYVGVCRGPGILQAGGLGYSADNWTTAAVIDAADYMEWSVTPNAGFKIDLATLDITYDRNVDGPTMVEIQIDVGGGFVTIFTDNAVSVIGEDNNGIDLSAYTNITGTITFRLFAFSATTAAGIFHLEQNAPTYKGIVINGTVAPNCTLVTTWNGVWAPAVPDNSYRVTIDAPYDTALHGGSFDACSLTVNADLNIRGTDYVQVTSYITINNADIIVASEASLVQLDDLSAMTLAGTGVVVF